MISLFEGLFWANVQIAVLAALLSVPAAALSSLLYGRVPAWRKGVWLTVLIAPPVAIVASLLLPSEVPSLLPVNWVASSTVVRK